MLKELWRKLEAEFLHNDCSGQDSQAGLFGTRPNGNKDGFRILPHITHTGEFHLERLTNLLRRGMARVSACPPANLRVTRKSGS